jgi:hypothetical protein
MDNHSLIENVLQRVAEKKSAKGYRMQPPCPPEALAQLQARTEAALKFQLPEGYLHFLSRSNGLLLNGTLIFASKPVELIDNPATSIDGFLEANQTLRVNAEQSIFFGDSDMDSYTFNLETAKFEVIDTVALEAVEQYGSFAELLAAAIEKRLT